MKHLSIAFALLAATLAFFQDADEVRPPEVGDPVPAFRLNDQDGKVVAIGGEKPGWTVIAFYPKALTPG